LGLSRPGAPLFAEAKTRQGVDVTRAPVTLQGRVAVLRDRDRELLRLLQRLGNAPAEDRILVVAGIDDKSPVRSGERRKSSARSRRQ
jgi:hypothetical protein